MKSRYPFIIAIAVIFIYCMTTFMASMVEARGGRGGRGRGGFSRSSPASGGSFSSRRATRQPTRQAKPRQDTRREQPRDSADRDDAREDRQQHRDDVREDRQDFVDDEWDDHYYHDDYHGGAAFVAGVAVGSAASSNYVTNVPCSTTVIVNNVTYYHCESTWYSRGSQGGEVVYIITSAPAGY